MELQEVTYEQVLAMKPCWLDNKNGIKRLKRYAEKLGGKATALDVLKLNRVSPEDRLWVVLHEEFVTKNTLHEFACQRAEQTIALLKDPDERSVDAILAKRAWVRGEIDYRELLVAWRAAAAAVQDVVGNRIFNAARFAVCVAAREALNFGARDAALGTTLWEIAANTAAQSSWITENKDKDTRRKIGKSQINTLMQMLEAD